MRPAVMMRRIRQTSNVNALDRPTTPFPSAGESRNEGFRRADSSGPHFPYRSGKGVR